MTNLKLYSKIINLRNRLELDDERGKDYTVKQIESAIELINQVNAVLDRRANDKRS